MSNLENIMKDSLIIERIARSLAFDIDELDFRKLGIKAQDIYREAAIVAFKSVAGGKDS
jgi:hypothetical protein